MASQQRGRGSWGGAPKRGGGWGRGVATPLPSSFPKPIGEQTRSTAEEDGRDGNTDNQNNAPPVRFAYQPKNQQQAYREVRKHYIIRRIYIRTFDHPNQHSLDPKL